MEEGWEEKQTGWSGESAAETVHVGITHIFLLKEGVSSSPESGGHGGRSQKVTYLFSQQRKARNNLTF